MASQSTQLAAKDDPFQPSPAVMEMRAQAKLPTDLMDGTCAMRRNASEWLKREPKEEDPRWEQRVQRSFLYPAFRDTVLRLTNKPFSQPMVRIGDTGLDPRLVQLWDSADRAGKPLGVVAKEMFQDALTYGSTYGVMDYPVTVKEDGQPMNKGEEMQNDVRPYLIHVPNQYLLGLREELSGGELQMFRYKRCMTVPDGVFGTKDVEVAVVWTKTTVQEFTKADDGSVVAGPVRNHTLNRVPAVVANFSPKDGSRWISTPTLDDLAWMNLKHFQSDSEQRNMLRFARCGILLSRGIADTELSGFVLGPAFHVKASAGPQECDMSWVEHSGSALGAGQADVERIEEQMEVLGLQPLIRRTSASTATGKMLDEARTHTEIMSWIEILGQTLLDAYKIGASWMPGVKLPEKFVVKINTDFGFSDGASNKADVLLKMRMTGELDRQTFLEHMKRLGYLDETTDPAQIQARLDTEEPSGNAEVGQRIPQGPGDTPRGGAGAPQGGGGPPRPASAPGGRAA